MMALCLLAVATGAADARVDYSRVGEWGELGSADGQFRRPVGIDVDRAGNVYVADFANGRVHIFKPDGAFDDSFEIRDSTGRLALPGGIAVDLEGNVYIATYYLGKVLKFARPA